MKRVSTIAAIFLVILLVMNVSSFVSINKRFINFLNSSLEQQTQLCGSYMEKTLIDFESDLNRLLFEYKFSTIFKDLEELDKSNRSLQVFYSKYRNLVTNIAVFDDERNYFGLYINEREQFVVDTFPRQRQAKISPRDKVEYKRGAYLYHYPYFENDEVTGNIIVEVDFEKFSSSVFKLYPLGKTITWQWIVSGDGEIICKSFPFGTDEIVDLEIIVDSIDMESEGIIQHAILDSMGRKESVYSAYYPLSIFNQNLGIVFSASQNVFKKFFISRNIRITISSFLATLLVVIYMLVLLGRRTRKEGDLKMSEIVFRQIIENFPVGIMILDSNSIIRNINSSTRRLLFIGNSEDLIGKDFSKQFLVSNKYLLKDDNDSIDNSDFLFYEKDGIETVIFRVEEKTRIGGEELRLIALIDVSPIERSRKQEVAANKAKSDFLASMSHEIRTPMNGILGMVSSLMESKLNKSAEEKLKIIKKSSDLLMTIINDILDFSKIEAGKMMLEEIPFLLREEISLVIELFKPLAEEKNLVIESDIMAVVPDKLIGDPFRLRQVITNLVSNAVKFTERGKIVIGVDVMEAYQSSMQLLFYVEDTGIGIPQDRIKSIFGSYTQTRGSVSRKFGGTGLGTAISKQLVELMNGEIWVESPSRISNSTEIPGSRFSFTIEVYSNEKIKKKYNTDGIKKLDQIAALFLTKESNPEKNSIKTILNNFGINIVTKIYMDSTVDSVIHHMNIKQDLYNMLILYDKNNLDGFALAKTIKDEGLSDKFPIILVSGNDKPGNYKISKQLWIDYYLIEPFESKEIYDIVKDIFKDIEEQPAIASSLNSLPEQLSILVVEDNLINQKVAQSIFKNIGYEIELAKNGAEAITLTNKKEYDIIFMDLFMPEVDGFEATMQMRKNGIKTPIIAMSADSDDERKADSIKAGMDEYLMKPAKVETVKQLLIKMFSSSLK
jgi:signal transduction histidine kinase/CheY-like chemotaxis protein